MVALLLPAIAPAWPSQVGLDDGRETREAMMHYAAGARALASEHYQDAADEFTTAVKLDPLLVIAHYGLGQAYMALKDYPSAVRAYVGCRKAFHDDVLIQIDRQAESEQRIHAEILAIEDQLAVAGSGAPGGGGLSKWKGAFTASNPAHMRELLDSLRTRRSRASAPDQDAPSWISLALGSAYFRNGAFADAEREYVAALKVEPGLGEAHFDLAVVYLSTKRPDDAERELAAAEKAGIKVPDDLRADLKRQRAPSPTPALSRHEGFLEEVLRRYSSDAPGAVAEVASWPAARLAELVAAAGAGPRSAGAALMLLTDAATRVRDTGGSAATQERAAAEIAHRVSVESSSDGQGRDFVRRWYEAVALQAQAETRWDDALAWTERGLKAFPGSPELLLVVASTEEVLAQRPTYSGSPIPVMDAQARQSLDEAFQARERRTHLERAGQAARDAVAAAPQRIDLQVRLGRVTWRLGDLPSARVTLASALERQPKGPDSYLARLFLGRVEQDAGRLAEAARSYEAAIALEPQCQAAHLALSHVELLLGDEAAARREAEAAIRPAGWRSGIDPFWLYPWGVSRRARALLETLRREAAP
jgi:tetratricopeptide (TPR) repeat protein